MEDVLLIDRGDVSVCPLHPGYEIDVTLSFPTPILANVFYGLDSWGRATKDGDIVIEGPPRLANALPSWFQPSPFAPLVAEVSAAGGEQLASG